MPFLERIPPPAGFFSRDTFEMIAASMLVGLAIQGALLQPVSVKTEARMPSVDGSSSRRNVLASAAAAVMLSAPVVANASPDSYVVGSAKQKEAMTMKQQPYDLKGIKRVNDPYTGKPAIKPFPKLPKK